MGCGASSAEVPLGDLFANNEATDSAPAPPKLQPESTPAEWLAFFDLGPPEADPIVEACAALGAVRAADVLLVSDEELASMRSSLHLPIPRRKFDRALRGLRAAAKRTQTRERPGSAAAFRAQPRERGSGDDSPPQSGGVGRCPFCDHPRETAHTHGQDTAPTTPLASPSRTDAGTLQDNNMAFETGRPSLQAPPWNPWQQGVTYPGPPPTAATQYAGLAAGPLVNNMPMLPPMGLHTTLPYFQQPLWQQSQQLQQQQQALLAATAAAQTQQWHNMAGWGSPQQQQHPPNASSMDRRPQSAAVTAQETAAAAALRRRKHGGGGHRRTKPPSTPPMNETTQAGTEHPTQTQQQQQQQQDLAGSTAANAALRAGLSARPWSAAASPAELQRKARENIGAGGMGLGMGTIGIGIGGGGGGIGAGGGGGGLGLGLGLGGLAGPTSSPLHLGGIARDDGTNGGGSGGVVDDGVTTFVAPTFAEGEEGASSPLFTPERRRRPQTADVHRPEQQPALSSADL